MWNRAELKARAKTTLKGVFWIAVLAVVIYALLTGNTGGNYTANMINQGRNQMPNNNFPVDPSVKFDFFTRIAAYPLALILSIIGAFGALIALLWSLFVAGPLSVGISRLFLQMKYEKEKFNIKTMFSIFSDSNYMNIVKSVFMTKLIIFLWTLLFIIPGIIKGYQYHFVPWILAEYPDMDYKTAMAYSKSLTDGQKFQIFILELSFLGWLILGSLLFGLGIPLVSTYEMATTNELYQVLKGNQNLDASVGAWTPTV